MALTTAQRRAAAQRGVETRRANAARENAAARANNADVRIAGAGAVQLPNAIREAAPNVDAARARVEPSTDGSEDEAQVVPIINAALAAVAPRNEAVIPPRGTITLQLLQWHCLTHRMAW